MPAFAPILGDKPKILLLGSMPSVKSLQAQQYYAHPRNAFWPIMQFLFSIDAKAEYRQRVAQLMANNICVWDVLYDCERPGSLDSRIVLSSERANNFLDFFHRHPSIEMVGFNGLAARKIFNRHCKSVFADFPSIRWVDLPSTSPAHAVLSVEQKVRIWAETLSQV